MFHEEKEDERKYIKENSRSEKFFSKYISYVLENAFPNIFHIYIYIYIFWKGILSSGKKIKKSHSEEFIQNTFHIIQKFYSKKHILKISMKFSFKKFYSENIASKIPNSFQYI